MNIEDVQVGQRVRIVNDMYTHSTLNGLEGVVVGLDFDSELPVDIDLDKSKVANSPVPFMASEIELID
jgi:hypothetical protein